MVEIVLTTYPEHKSGNVGDAMITASTVKLIRKRYPDFNPVILFREKPLDGFTRKKAHTVIAPGFSVSNNTYPDLYALFEDETRLKYFYPIGCSFQSSQPYEQAFEGQPYNAKTLKRLRTWAAAFGPFMCRDQKITDMLNRLDVPARLSGDLVLFDEELIGTALRAPTDIRSIVITAQHHIRYTEQIIRLMKLVKRRFPDAKRYLTVHSRPNALSSVITVRAIEIGFEVVNLYGPAENLDFYDKIDLHIGYRLHGHVTFLRKRKPSILFVEDNRAYGFSRTGEFRIGCVDAYNDAAEAPDDDAPDKAMQSLEEHISTAFEQYRKPLSQADQLYRDIISPYFDSLARALQTRYLTD